MPSRGGPLLNKLRLNPVELESFLPAPPSPSLLSPPPSVDDDDETPAPPAETDPGNEPLGESSGTGSFPLLTKDSAGLPPSAASCRGFKSMNADSAGLARFARLGSISLGFTTDIARPSFTLPTPPGPPFVAAATFPPAPPASSCDEAPKIDERSPGLKMRFAGGSCPSSPLTSRFRSHSDMLSYQRQFFNVILEK